MNTATQKVPWYEKVGYSLGDGAANLVFQMTMMFQLFFYTDVFGIKASTAGMILLIARVFDAFVDPVVGILSDRTNTRWGKYRPWILWTALPFAICLYFLFTIVTDSSIHHSSKSFLRTCFYSPEVPNRMVSRHRHQSVLSEEPHRDPTPDIESYENPVAKYNGRWWK
jgi:Na+/melibiose symporter-like transporter